MRNVASSDNIVIQKLMPVMFVVYIYQIILKRSFKNHIYNSFIFRNIYLKNNCHVASLHLLDCASLLNLVYIAVFDKSNNSVVAQWATKKGTW